MEAGAGGRPCWWPQKEVRRCWRRQRQRQGRSRAHRRGCRRRRCSAPMQAACEVCSRLDPSIRHIVYRLAYATAVTNAPSKRLWQQNMAGPEPPAAPSSAGSPDRDADDSIDFSSQPPPEATALTDDGQLHILTLRPGGGEQPPKHARCLGEASGRAAGRGARWKLGRQAPPPPPLLPVPRRARSGGPAPTWTCLPAPPCPACCSALRGATGGQRRAVHGHAQGEPGGGAGGRGGGPW